MTAGKRPTTQEYDRQLMEKHGGAIVRVGTFIGMTIHTLHECTVCTLQWTPEPYKLTNVGSGCPACYGRRRSELARVAQNRPEVRAKQSAASKAAHARPEVKANRSAVMDSPEFRAKLSTAIEKAMGRPEVKARMSEVRKEVMNRPEIKARMIAVGKEIASRGEVKAAKAAYMKNLWANPDVKAERAAAQKASGHMPRVWVSAKAGKLDVARTTFVYCNVFEYEGKQLMKIGFGNEGRYRQQLNDCVCVDHSAERLCALPFPSSGAAVMCERLIHVWLDRQNRRHPLPKGTLKGGGNTEIFLDLGNPAEDLQEALCDPLWDQWVAPRLIVVGVDPDRFRQDLLQPIDKPRVIRRKRPCV